MEEVDFAKELLQLQSYGGLDCLVIFPDAEPCSDGHWQFPRITAELVDNFGYVVQCFETTASRSFFLATSQTLTKPEVCIELGGLAQEFWPRQLFVPYEQALAAMSYFVQEGLQDPGFAWIGLSDFERKNVDSAPRK